MDRCCKGIFLFGVVVIMLGCGPPDPDPVPIPPPETEVEEVDQEGTAGEPDSSRWWEEHRVVPESRAEQDEEEELSQGELNPPGEEMEILGAEVQLTTRGDDDFVILEEGDVLRWEQGPQGGFHVWIGFQVIGLEGEQLSEGFLNEIIHEYELLGPDGELLGGATLRGFLRVGEDGAVQAPGYILRLRPPWAAAEEVGSGYRVILRLRNLSAQVHLEELEVSLSCCDYLD